MMERRFDTTLCFAFAFHITTIVHDSLARIPLLCMAAFLAFAFEFEFEFEPQK